MKSRVTQTHAHARLHIVYDVLLLACAIIVAASAARIAFARRVSSHSATAAPDSIFIVDSRDIAATGICVGDKAAPVVIMEFVDFECPACKAYAPVLRKIHDAFPQRVAIVFKHWPLDYHRFA
jgi:protein-disulfide isomerase